MNKKLSSLVTILLLGTASVFASGQELGLQESKSEPENTAIITLDTEKNEYTIEYDGKQEKGSLITTATVGTDNFYNIATFTSIDTQKLTVTSASNNKGNLHVKAVKSKDHTVHYSNNGQNLSPGGKWTTAGGLSGFGEKYTIIAKASVKGSYSLSLKW
ncbi:MAG: hypothetical protein R3Y64_09600 [Peptostreptococcaceae bacterium]